MATPDPASDDLEREIRQGRAFTLEEALGRLMGGGMKGASPVSRLDQARQAVAWVVRKRLRDREGALAAVVVREMGDSQSLLDRLEQPVEALRGWLAAMLDDGELLADLVRAADVQWGRTLGERPFFDRPGATPHLDDPYTADSVRAALQALHDELGRIRS